MNRRKFALSWGRKIFFGLSLPLSLLIGLLYFKSYVLPQDVMDLFYLVTSYFGTIGVLNILVYFFLYAPIVLIFPSYYVSRIWSLILIILMNACLIIDAYTYSSYHQHIYGYLSDLVMEEGLSFVLGGTGMASFLTISMLVLAVVIWFRGEQVWRSMQRRFSNPVSNWYLGLIVLSLILSKGIFYLGKVPLNLITILPFDYQFNSESHRGYVEHRRFNYPTEELKCTSKQNANIITIVLREWSVDQLNPEIMPSVFDMKKHAISYQNHFGTGLDADSGMFSFYHFIPGTYSSSMKGQPLVWEEELKKRSYEFFLARETGASPKELDDKNLEKIQSWLDLRGKDQIQPFYIDLMLNQHASEVDKTIVSLVNLLQKKGELAHTMIVLTGAYSGNQDDSRVPLLIFNLDRKKAVVDHVTTHYDVLPTLIKNSWNCKNKLATFSSGKLLSDADQDWVLLSGNDVIKVLDVKQGVLTSLGPSGISDKFLKDKNISARRDILLDALKETVRFSKRN